MELLTKERRTKIRSIAREAWIESENDIEKAKPLASKKIRYEFGILTWLLILNAAISLCYTLWRWWQSMQMSVPPETPAPGEPE